MAAPTTAFKTLDRTTVLTLLDTKAKRISEFNGGSPEFPSAVDTGANPLDFGTVDISGGAADSLVFYLGWKTSANGGNTTVDNFRVWYESSTDWGFTLAGTDLKQVAIRFEAGSNASLYVVNAVVGTYTWADVDVAGAPSQNAYAGNDGTSIDITTIDTTDDIVVLAQYLAVADNEVTGTYQGTTSGKEFRGSFRYDYS